MKGNEKKFGRGSRCRCLHARPPVVSKTSRIPRFGARCWLWWVRRSDLGRSPLSPSFLSSSPANNRAGGDWPSRKQAQGVGAARSLRRGHGPARLDGQAAPATVTGLAMKEWKDEDPANGHVGDEPTPRGERPRVRSTPGWRSTKRVARYRPGARGPIRRSLFGGIAGRQACAAGWAASRPLEWGAIGPSTPSSKKGPRPWGYMSPFSAIDKIDGPATIM
jgi:hypothetical protein